ELVREQYAEARAVSEAESPGDRPEWASAPTRTKDEESFRVLAACGTLPEVERAVELGMSGVGLYRTELMYLIDSGLPSVEVLSTHYAAVFDAASRCTEDEPVTFRLLDADSGLRGASFHQGREPNPELGCGGVRLLLSREQLLRTQLRAMLSASRGAALRILVPFVNDVSDLRRVRELLFEERFSLRKVGSPEEDRVELGAVIETPSAALGASALAEEADFLVLSLDGLSQYLLAADRQNLDLQHYFAPLHPIVLRTVEQVADACRARGIQLSIYGPSMRDSANLPLLFGAGVREFLVSPATLRAFRTLAENVDVKVSRFAVRAARECASQEELIEVVARAAKP
ncbi:MAG: putative PEP-binding protein, partial [Planctomycetota bacterium]